MPSGTVTPHEKRADKAACQQAHAARCQLRTARGPGSRIGAPPGQSAVSATTRRWLAASLASFCRLLYALAGPGRRDWSVAGGGTRCGAEEPSGYRTERARPCNHEWASRVVCARRTRRRADLAETHLDLLYGRYVLMSGDNPIENVADDLIGRQSAARVIAEEIRTVDASKGCVIGIMGPWGSGKTSLVNLLRHELAKDPALPVLDFNPWMFSGTEQLVDSFFRELAAQLKVKNGRLEGIASQVEAYGDLLSPVGDALTILGVLPFGGMIGRARNAAGALKNLQERRKRSVTEQRKLLSDKLAELDRPIVVVLDDIDRLLTSEIRDIFRLVRLTASFPNIVYLVAFDRKRVEEALTETGVDGRAYLEKIVQIAFDIPILPQGVLLSQLGRALGDALKTSKTTCDLTKVFGPTSSLRLFFRSLEICVTFGVTALRLVQLSGQ